MGRISVPNTIREIFQKTKTELNAGEVIRILDEQYALVPKNAWKELTNLTRAGFLIRKKAGGKNGSQYAYRLRK